MNIDKSRFPKLRKAYDEQDKAVDEFLRAEFNMYFSTQPNFKESKFDGYSYMIVKIGSQDTTTITSPSLFAKKIECERTMYLRAFALCESELTVFQDEIVHLISHELDNVWE